MYQIKIKLSGSVQSRAEASGLLRAPGDVVIIQRGIPRWLLMKCPCGCNEDLPVNLDGRAGPAWRYYPNNISGMSVYPSVWRDTGCQSHFIIRRGIIYLFGKVDDDWDSQGFFASNDALKNAVVELLPSTELINYVDVADKLNEIPWDILDVCRQLVREGRAREGLEKQRGNFGRVKETSENQKKSDRSWRA